MSDRVQPPTGACEGSCLPVVDSRLLLVAFACHPDNSMEERNGWNRALQAAEDFDVTVVCSPGTNVQELTARIPFHLSRRLRFVALSAGALGNYCVRKELLFYLGYRIWHGKVLRFAKKLHAQAPFAVTHMVSVCGYREPGYLWMLDCPFVWGPVGGTSNFPLSFLSTVDLCGGLFELARNALNSCQLNLGLRVRRATLRAAAVFAANRSTQRDLQQSTGATLRLELEAGIDYEIGMPKGITSDDRPLRILWVGRLRPWKGFPILLHALAALPKSQQFEVRVVGDGACKVKWMRMAERLGVADKITWFAKPHYRESLYHYEWADVFAFTSLRDTSGTGLLESLAAGVPIVALDHQGAADVLTPTSGIRVPVSNPKQTIAAFSQALSTLANERQLLHELSRGAIERAAFYSWSVREPLMRNCYASVTNIKPKLTIEPESTLVH
ncbi:MAG: glycosyltransferase [Pirellulaceae bacterium]|nr:glycosyltransferase [Pirellulaceae bacterium]